MTEERLRRLEALLGEVLRRVEALEAKLSPEDARASRMAVELAIAFSLPAVRAVESAFRAARVLSRAGLSDDLSKAIVEALSTSRAFLTVSELTRRFAA